MKKILWVFILLLVAKVSFAASGEAGHDNEIPGFVKYQAINFVLLVGLLYGLTRKKMVSYFTGRVEKHGKAKEDAIRAFQEAQSKHEEVKQKLHSLHEGEELAIAKAQEEAKLLKSKLIHEADELGKTILADAKKTAQYEYDKAKQTLRSEAFDQAILLSKENIQKGMSKEDQKNLQHQFVESVGAQT